MKSPKKNKHPSTQKQQQQQQDIIERDSKTLTFKKYRN